MATKPPSNKKLAVRENPKNDKVTLRQRHFIIEYLETYVKEKERGAGVDLLIVWKNMTEILNSFSDSPKKSISAWLTVWQKMKKTIDKKLELMETQKTLTIPKAGMVKLNPFELRILSLMSSQKDGLEVTVSSRRLLPPPRDSLQKGKKKGVVEAKKKTLGNSYLRVLERSEVKLESISSLLVKISEGQEVMIRLLEGFVGKKTSLSRTSDPRLLPSTDNKPLSFPYKSLLTTFEVRQSETPS